MQTLRSLGSIVNVQTLLVTTSAVVSTYLCRKTGLMADFPLTLIGTAIIFPVVFSIGGAYKRREAALGAYGSMKAHGRAIFFATRDWIENPSLGLQEEAREHLDRLLSACRDLFKTPVQAMDGPEEQVYREFSELSRFIADSGTRVWRAAKCHAATSS